MAERRSIYKKISVSEPIAALSDRAKLLFTWSIPHADDIGILPSSAKTLKALVLPMVECSVAEVEGYIKEISAQGLYIPVVFDEKSYLLIHNFTEHQTLKMDRQPQTVLQITLSKNVKTSWETARNIVKTLLESSGFQLESKGFQVASEVKRSEEKGSEEKRKEIVPQTAPNPLVKEIIDFFHKATKQIRHIDPIISGHDAKMVKDTLEKKKISQDRLEKMIIWYLSRQKKVENTVNGSWTKEFKYPPALSTMLSKSFLSQLLSDEENALTYMQQNLEWVGKLYTRIDPKKSAGVKSIADLLKELSANKKVNV